MNDGIFILAILTFCWKWIRAPVHVGMGDEWYFNCAFIRRNDSPSKATFLFKSTAYKYHLMVNLC